MPWPGVSFRVFQALGGGGCLKLQFPDQLLFFTGFQPLPEGIHLSVFSGSHQSFRAFCSLAIIYLCILISQSPLHASYVFSQSTIFSTLPHHLHLLKYYSFLQIKLKHHFKMPFSKTSTLILSLCCSVTTFQPHLPSFPASYFIYRNFAPCYFSLPYLC